MLFRFIALAGLLFCSIVLYPQDTAVNGGGKMAEKYINTATIRCEKVDEKITAQSRKVLNKMQREEEKLRKQLFKIDSAAAKVLFAESPAKYAELRNKLTEKGAGPEQTTTGNYIPFLDTLKTSLKFLQGNGSGLLPINKAMLAKAKEASAKAEALKGKFDAAGSIQKYLRERRQYLKEQLSKFGMGKQLKKLNKNIFYYSQLIKDYKQVISDPTRIERHAIAMLNKIPAFEKFMQKNSALTSVFGVPAGGTGTISFAGVQTRASVQQLVNNAAITAGPNPAQYISQQLQTANDQLSALKNKVAFIDLSGNPEPMPDFKINQEKTKPFLKRLEIGGNVQFGKVNNYLPSMGDFAFSIGYKLNSKSVIGIGSSYKLGLGSFSRIQLSNQGFGLRSYIDWKIKGNYYFSGGYERNYLPQLRNLDLPQRVQTSQESGLVGLSKKINISKKRKLTFQLSYDFLSYKNTPRSQPVLIRTGWVF